jgi:4'-phosphopantetheinyl transferase EntD
MHDPVASQLEAVLREALPAGVAVAAAAVSAAGALLGVEAEAARPMAPRRQQEFAAGRACARRALAALGHPEAAIPMGPDRSPAWPAGICASITHASGYALAAAAPRGLLAGLGIDLEDCAPLDADLVARVCSPAEAACHPRDIPPGAWPRAVFSAKESLYKCVHARIGRFIDFTEIEVRAGVGGALVFAPATAGAGLRLVTAVTGCYRVAGEFVVTAAWLGSGVQAPP